jgi:hypothetical protein
MQISWGVVFQTDPGTGIPVIFRHFAYCTAKERGKPAQEKAVLSDVSGNGRPGVLGKLCQSDSDNSNVLGLHHVEQDAQHGGNQAGDARGDKCPLKGMQGVPHATGEDGVNDAVSGEHRNGDPSLRSEVVNLLLVCRRRHNA